MAEFLNRVYSIDNIIIYLIAAIAILVIIFVVILLTGKKDQKLEETKKIERLNQDLAVDDAFKEEPKEPAAVEIAENIPEKYPDILINENTNNNIVSEPVKEPVNEELLPQVEPEEENEKTVTIPFEPINEVPTLVKEEEKPLVINDVVSEPEKEPTKIEEPSEVETIEFDHGDEFPDIEIVDSFEESQPVQENIEIPSTEEGSIMPVEPVNSNSNQEVFSSVFVNKPEENKSSPVEDFKPINISELPEVPDIDMKSEEVEPQIVQELPGVPVDPIAVVEEPQEFVSEKVEQETDDEELELPILKNEESKPVNSPDFAAIANEKYDIK